MHVAMGRGKYERVDSLTQPCEHPPVPVSLSPALTDAHDTNYADFSTSYARRAGSDLERGALFDRAIVDLPALPYNGVFRSNLPRVDIAPGRS
jgi:hypothetical protein